jgi:hypothetical protein
MLWGDKTEATFGFKPRKIFSWNPWAERLNEMACSHQYLAILGCAKSSKTTYFSIKAIIDWLCCPTHTLVFVTSTSMKAARKLIWGSITDYFMAVPGLPGKLIESQCAIRTHDGINHYSDKCGIFLIPGERKKEKEAIGKLIGLHNERVLMTADEMPELSDALINAALSNIQINPYFEFKCIGNFASIYDPLGQMAKPKEGWGAVSQEDTEWETDLGYCVRLDGLKSPNIISGEDEWPEIYTTKNLASHRKSFGENTAEFWRMCRSFPCPEGEQNAIYCEADFIRGAANRSPIWYGKPIRIAGADPSFTSGGDRFVVYLGSVGKDSNQREQVSFDRYVVLREDLSIQTEARDIQMARQLISLCKREQIAPQNLGLDTSGPGGLAFASIISTMWSDEFVRVNFGAKASERQVSVDDRRTGFEAFSNRVSEIWFIGRDLIRSGKIKGISGDMAKEMRSRRYVTEKTINMRIKVESKTDMKERIGFSPDIADSGFVMLDVARQRHRFGLEGEFPGRSEKTAKRLSEFHMQVNDVYANANYSEDVYAAA